MTITIDLGRTTEARFAAAFARSAIITAMAAADLIGLDEKTLAALSDRQIIRSVPRGKLRAYTERDLRSYLVEGPPAECRSTSHPRAASTTSTSNIVAGDFMARRAAKLSGKPKR